MNRESLRALILFVEDDDGDALLVKRAFSKLSIDADLRHLTNGDDAVSYLSGSPEYADRGEHPIPLLILLDLKLPRRNGIEVTRWVRSRSDSLRRLPIVMFTSSSRTADVNEAYDAGVNSYLVKPNTNQELQDRLLSIREYWLGINRFPEIPLPRPQP